MIRSLMSVFPVVAMDSADMTCIGLVLTAFGAAMREPVTTISVSSDDIRVVGGDRGSLLGECGQAREGGRCGDEQYA